MKCPRGHSRVVLSTPDYGRGAEFVCLDCPPGPNGHLRFVSDSSEARELSRASEALSSENARGGRR